MIAKGLLHVKPIPFCVVLLLASSTSAVLGQGGPLSRIEHSADSTTVVVDDPRPLWIAVEALRNEYGWLIDYEDPIYGVGDTQEVQNAAFERRFPGRRSRMPVGGHFSSTFTGALAPQVVIDKVLADYNASGNPGQFEKRIDERGRTRVVAKMDSLNVLDTEIRVTASTKGSLTEVYALVSTLTEASGVKVKIGMMPWNLLNQARVTFAKGTMPARAVLMAIADSTQPRLMWSFLYDYDSQSYFLSLSPQSGAAVVGAGSPLPAWATWDAFMHSH
jgi:hypothetical protein